MLRVFFSKSKSKFYPTFIGQVSPICRLQVKPIHA